MLVPTDLKSAVSRMTSLRDCVAENERVLHDERPKFEARRGVINFVLDGHVHPSGATDGSVRLWNTDDGGEAA
jgi:hypothetical protein